MANKELRDQMRATILLVEQVTRDVKRLVMSKPEGLTFVPGQATNVRIDKPGYVDKPHEFTFTSTPDDLVVEFTIKGYPVDKYPKHEGVTEKLHTLRPGDQVLLSEPFGAIHYRKPGVFIAGGAGITPFLSIFRDLSDQNKLTGNMLLFSNKRKGDVIVEQELRALFAGDSLWLTLTRENVPGYHSGRIDRDVLKQTIHNFDQAFYVCGPPPMVKDVVADLKGLGAQPEKLVLDD